MHSHVLRFLLKKPVLIQPTCLCSAMCSSRDADRCALSDHHTQRDPEPTVPSTERFRPHNSGSVHQILVGGHKFGGQLCSCGEGRGCAWKWMQCKSRSPALEEGHLRLWGAVQRAGRRYRRVPSAKTEEAQDSLLGAGGTGPSPRPLASALGGALQREKAAAPQGCSGRRETAKERGPSRAAAPRPSHPLTPPHYLTHNRSHSL